MTGASTRPAVSRRPRADVLRNREALLRTAAQLFDEDGVDVPLQRIADASGMGIGTLYRHFPRRTDLIRAVFQHRVEACALLAHEIPSEHDPLGPLVTWTRTYLELLSSTRGLARALASSDASLEDLRPTFFDRLEPAVAALLDRARLGAALRDDVSAQDLMRAIARLGLPVAGEPPEYNIRLVRVFVDGLRTG